MFLNIFMAASFGLTLYGISDFSLSKTVADYNDSQYLGKFRHANHWLLFLNMALVFSFFLRKTGMTFAKKQLRWMLSVMLPNQLVITPLYLYVLCRYSLSSINKGYENSYNIMGFGMHVIQHIVPCITACAIWRVCRISIDRRMQLVNTVLILLYAVVLVLARAKNGEWSYPYLNDTKSLSIFLIIAAYTIIVLLLYEGLMIIDNMRRKNEVKAKIFEKKRQ